MAKLADSFEMGLRALTDKQLVELSEQFSQVFTLGSLLRQQILLCVIGEVTHEQISQYIKVFHDRLEDLAAAFPALAPIPAPPAPEPAPEKPKKTKK